MVGTTSGGTAIVHIVPPPRDGGTSINRFTTYDIGPAGVVLTNTGRGTGTVLAGLVAGNPMLGTRYAGVIVQQVTGGAASRLQGLHEVTGFPAAVVIANPAGLVCSGCGALHASRFVLTTGTPLYDGEGNPNGFDVRKGMVSIGEKGLEATEAHVDLLARSIEVNGRIQGSRMNAVAGANSIAYPAALPAGGEPVPAAQIGEGETPARAIQLGPAGAIRAQGVRLVGTEAASNVRLDGHAEAAADDLVLDHPGRIEVGESAVLRSAGVLEVDSGQLTNAGKLLAREAIELVGHGREAAVDNAGVVASAGTLLVDAARIGNSGRLDAGRPLEGETGAPSPTGRAVLRAQQTLQSSGTIVAAGDLEMSGATLDLARGTIEASGVATLRSGTSIGNGDGRIQGGTVSIAAGHDFDNAGGSVAASAGGAAVRAQKIVNGAGRIEAGGSLLLQSDTEVDNRGGSLWAGADLESYAPQLRNSAGHVGAPAGAIALNGTVDNSHGAVEAGGALRMHGGAIDNRSGSIKGGEVLLEPAGISLDNRDGEVNAGSLTVLSGLLDNRAGRIAAAGAVDVDTRGEPLLNNEGGRFDAGGPVRLHATVIGNGKGSLSSGGDLELKAGTVANDGGQMRAAGSAFLSSGTLSNRHGAIDAAGDATLDVAVIDNTAGGLRAGKVLGIRAARLVNSDGQLLAGDTVQLRLGGPSAHCGWSSMAGKSGEAVDGKRP